MEFLGDRVFFLKENRSIVFWKFYYISDLTPLSFFKVEDLLDLLFFVYIFKVNYGIHLKKKRRIKKRILKRIN
jgi:hypothetical protein